MKTQAIQVYPPDLTSLSHKVIIVFSLACMLMLNSCRIPGNLTYTNLASQYDADNCIASLETRLFNQDDSVSVLYIRFPLNELSYRKSKDSSCIFASFKIVVQLYDSYNTSRLVDTFSSIFTDTLRDNMEPVFERDFNIKARRGNNYLLMFSLIDLNKGSVTFKFISLQKKTKTNRNNFLPLKVDNSLICNDFITDNSWMKIRLNCDSIKWIAVRYYHREFPIALPPFAFYEPQAFKYKADSVFYLAVNNKESEIFDMKNMGFYHFQIDTTNKEGMSLFRFGEEFPLLKTAESIIPPVRYLTTTKEFEDLASITNKKEAIDNFWLSIAGNPSRAKALIKNYYSRVTFANKYFTSYLEGWKTDRGMIYIIFGKPSIVYRSDYSESWVYGARGSIASTKFDFIKVNNPFTDNDYLLYRSPAYKDSWYVNADNWRR